jgi:V/A-type H+-transporting ATPase subunit E
MAIEDIFRALDEQAQAECDDLLAVAEGQASSIMEEARREADRITQAKVAAADKVASTKASKTLNAARLDGRKTVAGVRDAAVARVFDDALVKLAAFRSTPDYPAVFKTLAEEALAGIEGPCDLLVDPADADLARSVAVDRGRDCTVVPEAQSSGGVIVTSAGGRVVRSNTFESRLGKSRGLIQARVAEILGS